jgi:Ni/Fe-hydrogenase subunit HybB-like protein
MSKWLTRLTSETTLGLIIPTVATLGGIVRYRELTINPQKLRRRTRRTSLLAAAAAAVSFAVVHPDATSASSPTEPSRSHRSRSALPKLVLGVAASLAAFLLVEGVIGKRREISNRRALALATSLTALLTIERAAKGRLRRWGAGAG